MQMIWKGQRTRYENATNSEPTRENGVLLILIVVFCLHINPFRTAVRFLGTEPLKFQVVCPQNGTAALKGLDRFFYPALTVHPVSVVISLS